MQLEVYNGLEQRRFEAPALREIRLPDFGSPWLMVAAMVELDARGGVQHVFLESSTGKPDVADRACRDADGPFVKGLYRGQGSPGRAGDSGRVKLFLWRRDAGGGNRSALVR